MSDIVKYLERDVTGGASNFPYGLRGQRVVIIKEEAGMCLVQDDDGSRFYTRSEYLTDNKPEDVSTQSTTSVNPIYHSKTRKGSNTKIPPPAQPGLFG